MLSDPICLRVKGPFACFTRPEFHVERVSYPIITPSAARGILEAILMKPIEKPEAHKRHNKTGFRWVITRLGIIRKGTMFSILRNELGYSTHQPPEKATGYDINANRIRAQRHSLILRDVEYLIEAIIEVPSETRQRVGRQFQTSAEFLARNKYHQMFLRRARVGQCFYHPFFGCREFSVDAWSLIEEHYGNDSDGNRLWSLSEHDAAAMSHVNENFGVIFRDFDYRKTWDYWGHEKDKTRPKKGWSQPGHTPVPKHFTAHAVNGWIKLEREDQA